MVNIHIYIRKQRLTTTKKYTKLREKSHRRAREKDKERVREREIERAWKGNKPNKGRNRDTKGLEKEWDINGHRQRHKHNS